MEWTDLDALLEHVKAQSPASQALYGTFFTWFMTAVGAAFVFLVPSSFSAESERKVVDISMGFAAGVMLAASFWSLLAPAVESGQYIPKSDLFTYIASSIL